MKIGNCLIRELFTHEKIYEEYLLASRPYITPRLSCIIHGKFTDLDFRFSFLMRLYLYEL